MSLLDKVVLVTGASSGIGAAIAIKFVEEGAKVTIVGRNENKLTEVFQKCEKKGSKPLQIVADVTKESDAKRIVNETINHFGKLDVLVNNAGISGSVSILAENALQVFDQTMATNLRSAVLITHLAAKHLVETRGNIINMSSVAAINVLSKKGFPYCASKAGLDHFTKCIAYELADKGVRVNSINPGPVQTDIIENSGANQAVEAVIWNLMKASTVLDRISDPEEIADLALFLASDKARSITGSSYVIDNGALLKGPLIRD